MKSTMFWPPSDRRLEQRHERGSGGGEADGEHDPVDEGVAALLAADAFGRPEEPEEQRVEHGDHSFRALDGLGEEAKEAVGEQEYEHGQQRCDRRVHGEVGAVGGALEVAVLLGSRLRRLLAKELEVGALLGGEQLAEAREARLAHLTGNPDERLALAE